MPPSTSTAEDMPLTETGREQAEVLAVYLAQHLPLSAVYASPLRRTQETAAPLAAAQGLPVVTLAGLREIETYIPGGLSLREYLGDEQFLQMQQRVLRERTWDARGELYEGSAAFRKRVCEAVERAIAENRGGRIALVTHGPVINAYLASILRSPIDLLFQPRLTSITVVLARDELRNLSVVNSTPHFGTF
jgi:probable phosphoglycerate mutase